MENRDKRASTRTQTGNSSEAEDDNLNVNEMLWIKAPVRSGWIYKQGFAWRKKWSKRWVVLSGRDL